jgi:type II secretory pathway predicted ATPase ExeA
MYERFYGLSELPFELTANPRYLFLSETQREALSVLQYGLFSAKSLTLLIGEAGTGKTTLTQAALASERCRDVRCIYVNNPALRTEQFTDLLALKFDLGGDCRDSKPLLLERLEQVLKERRDRGEITALVIDEAQSLSMPLLEEIRLLANIETPSSKLLPLVLAGQPELDERIDDPSLRQLKQRVTLRCRLQPFDLPETAGYIAHRIATAGGAATDIFTREAIRVIHEYSTGIPRTINVICDNALVGGMAFERRHLGGSDIESVCRELRLTSPRPALAQSRADAPSDPVDAGARDVVPPDSAQSAPQRARRGFWARRMNLRRAAALPLDVTGRIVTE